MKTQFYSFQECEKDIKKLSKMIKIIEDENCIKFKNVYPMKRGGFYLGLRLSHLLGIPIVTHIGQINKEETIIIDDIIDTGETLFEFKDYFVISIFYVTQAKFKPKLYIHKTNNFINFFWEKDGIPLKSERSQEILNSGGKK